MTIKSKLPRSTPEKQGIVSSAILKFINVVEENNLELHSFMLLRHGYVVSEGWWSPYSSERPHMLFSLSKSFTSTGIGLVVSEGLLSVEDKVISFFPEDTPNEVSEHLSSLKIKHLLSMSTGHAEDASGRTFSQKDGNWVKGFLDIPIDYEPGTHFVYNTAATYILSAIIQKVTGQTLLEYLKPRLFVPLGIEGARWETCPRGINTGGFGLDIRTEDIAKFGQLYLQKGVWNSKQILEKEWVEEATSIKISNGSSLDSDWEQGYCYQFWRCRHNVYRGDGAFGQFCVVMPDQDAVIAITSGINDMQKVLNVIWECLLSAMSSEELTENIEDQAELEEKLKSLELVHPKGLKNSPTAEKISNKQYKIEDNELNIQNISFNFDENSCTLEVLEKRGKHIINCGIENWLEGKSDILEPQQIVNASGTWIDENNFSIILRFVESPFSYTISCYFKDEELEIKLSTNVSFGPSELPQIKGRMIN